MNAGPKLVMILPAPARLASDGRVVLSKKLVSGVVEHQRGWPGPIHLILAARRDSGGIEDAAFDLDTLPFTLTVADLGHPETAAIVRGAALVMFSAQVGYTSVPQLCRSLGVPCIGITEYTLRTRTDIVQAETSNPLRLLKRTFQEALWELGNRQAVRNSSGVQANGTPTFNAYKRVNANTILYLDTRVPTKDLATAKSLESKFAARRAGGKLRLAFSGRLTAMKGARNLIPLASRLRERNIPFSLTICGDGDLAPQIASDIARRNLQDQVTMTGSLDFLGQLMPLMKSAVDLFVCCHPQGDPSCTYLETMSCGVPIVGYGNEAFTGLAKMAGFGWVTPMNRPDLMADQIAMLRAEEIEAHSLGCLAFASQHTFEIEFDRRMKHARDVAGVAMPVQ